MRMADGHPLAFRVEVNPRNSGALPLRERNTLDAPGFYRYRGRQNPTAAGQVYSRYPTALLPDGQSQPAMQLALGTLSVYAMTYDGNGIGSSTGILIEPLVF